MNLYKILIISLIILAVVSIYKKFRSYHPSIMYYTQKITPKTTLFAFDLHGVVVKPDYCAIIKLIQHNFFHKAQLSLLFKPILWSSIYTTLQNNLSSEYIFDKLIKEYGQTQKLKTLIAQIISTQKLNKPAIQLISNLKKEGYCIYILSNIWAISLQQLYQKFPELTKLFDGAYIPQSSNGFIAKPNPIFYQNFKLYLAEQGQTHKQIIFIDNGKKNIIAARQAGFIALDFNALLKNRKGLTLLTNLI